MKIDGLPPPNVVDTNIFGIWIEGDWSSEQFDAFFFNLGQKLSDWRNFQKKIRTPRKWWETGIYLKIGGDRKFFWKLCQSLNFCPRSKKKASNCSEEQSPSIQIPKILVSTTLGGGARQFSYQQFFRGKLKVQGLPPPQAIIVAYLIAELHFIFYQFWLINSSNPINHKYFLIDSVYIMFHFLLIPSKWIFFLFWPIFLLLAPLCATCVISR